MPDKGANVSKSRFEGTIWTRSGLCCISIFFLYSVACVALFLLEEPRRYTEPHAQKVPGTSAAMTSYSTTRLRINKIGSEPVANHTTAPKNDAHKYTLWRCYNKGKWNKSNYIPESPEQNCRELVSRFLKDIQPKRWIFLGDSTMRRLFGRIASYKTLQCRRLKKCENDCPLNVYLDMSPGEAHGKACKGRGDGCKSELFGCENRVREVEFIQNHFTSNGMVKGANATKYSLLSAYLEKHPKDVCVVNAGLHDQGHIISDSVYVQNVKTYLSYLFDKCKRTIWISTNCVLGLKKYGQSNKSILRWNDLIEQMLRTEYPRIAYIDMFPMSTIKSMHQDNGHMKPVYYSAAANFFL